MESANGGHYHLQRNERRNHSLSLENKNWIENVIQLVSTVALTQLPVRKHSVTTVDEKKKKKNAKQISLLLSHGAKCFYQ